jgi:hypothetical protein
MMISEKDAMELLRKGRLLTRMHTKVGLKWFVIPGGQIADTVAKKNPHSPGHRAARWRIVRGLCANVSDEVAEGAMTAQESKSLQGLMFLLDRKADRKEPCCENSAIVFVDQESDAVELKCKKCRKHRFWLSKKEINWYLTILAFFPEAARDVHVYRDATDLGAVELRRRRAKERQAGIQYDDSVETTAQLDSED